MKIIVGLGNPGKEYENTRHNVGYMAVDQLAGYGLRVTGFKKENRLKSEIAEIELNSEKVLLARPVTFMNKSGEAIVAILRMYKDRVDVPSGLIVIHDDTDLPLGRMKIQKGGGSAGHHGIESIAKSLGTKDFIRIRVGVRSERGKAMEFILQGFSAAEKKILDKTIGRAVEAITVAVTEGVEKAMNEYNTR